MSVRIIATDLDGTLMAPDHLTVTPRTVSALKKASEKGVKIAIATGRTFSLVEDVVSQIPFADYIIYSNGAGVYDIKHKKIVFSDFIKSKTAMRILKFLEKYPACYEAYYNGTSYMQKDKLDCYENKDLPQEFLEKLVEKMNLCENVVEDLKGKDLEKINIYYIPEPYREEIEEFVASEEEIVSLSAVSDDMELTRADVDKANALHGICKVLNISQSEVMTFGDAQNDCGMLKYAEYSFAMENATPACKESSRFITQSNANDGVARAVEKFVLGE